MHSVRARITALTTVLSAVVLCLAGVALVKVLEHQLIAQSDGASQARAVDLAESVLADSFDVVVPPLTDEGLAQVVAADGRVLAASPNLAGKATIAAPALAPGRSTVRTLRAPDDAETENYRIAAVAVRTRNGVVTVFVGTSLESVSEATRTLRRSLLIGIPLLLLLVAAGTWAVVSRSLARVDRVRSEVDVLGEGDLSRRLEAGPPDEIGRLVTTMNALLARLETAQVQQRAFVADASHELQSPLTAFRVQLEVAAAHPESADWAGLREDLLADTARMEALVKDLLLLAAGDDPAPAAFARLDLADLVEVVVHLTRPRDGVEVTVTAEGPTLVAGDAGQLEGLVRNLLDNSVRHARSSVAVRLRPDGDHVVLSIHDDGPGIAEADRERVFDRFYRGDPSRARTGTGTGLGLAISRALARRHGGDVRYEAGAGATFVVTLPLAP